MKFEPWIPRELRTEAARPLLELWRQLNEAPSEYPAKSCVAGLSEADRAEFLEIFRRLLTEPKMRRVWPKMFEPVVLDGGFAYPLGVYGDYLSEVGRAYFGPLAQHNRLVDHSRKELDQWRRDVREATLRLAELVEGTWLDTLVIQENFSLLSDAGFKWLKLRDLPPDNRVSRMFEEFNDASLWRDRKSLSVQPPPAPGNESELRVDWLENISRIRFHGRISRMLTELAEEADREATMQKDSLPLPGGRRGQFERLRFVRALTAWARRTFGSPQRKLVAITTNVVFPDNERELLAERDIIRMAP